MRLTAADLYAISQGYKNQGMWQCHWCGSSCQDSFQHDDPPRMIGVRRPVFAKHPSAPWICKGCWLWRRKNLSVTFLDRTWKDRQTPQDYSWWVTPEGAWGVNEASKKLLYERLIQPPRCFLLALVDGDCKNHLQLCAANATPEINGTTELAFTLNGIAMTYSVFDLENAVRDKNAGAGPGVLSLIRWLGVERQEFVHPKTRGTGTKGRTKEELADNRAVKKVVQTSGAVLPT